MSAQPINVVSLDDMRRDRSEREPWMTKAQLARHLGFSVRWVEYRVAEGLPHTRIGGRLRFQAGVCEAWLMARERGAA